MECSLTPHESDAPQILVVDDDDIVREVVMASLRQHGFEAIEAVDVDSALLTFSTTIVDLVIVDIMLPDGSGFDLARRLRETRECAVIYLTSLAAAEDRVRGLEGDGDDYLIKPIETWELLARVRAVLRRYQRAAPAETAIQAVIEFGGWTLDLVRRELADPRSTLVPLTRAEFDVFAALVQAQGIALSRDYLIEVAASAQSTTKSRTIDVMVSRVRRKLVRGGPPLPQIMTIQGQGYRFKSPSP
jgi:DNA-binding response OmpR family regulator